MTVKEVTVTEKSDNKYRINYKVQDRDGEGIFLLEPDTINQDVFDTRIFIEELDKVIDIQGIFDLRDYSQKETLYQEFLNCNPSHQPLYGSDEDIWEALIRSAEIIDKGEAFSEEEQKRLELTPEMKEFLTDNTLNKVYYLIKRVRKKPLVREWVNSIVAYLTILSSKINEPLTLVFDGPSMSGKTYLCVRSKDLFGDMIDVIMSGSKEAYKYSSDMVDDDGVTRIIDMRGKCIIFLERDQSEELIKKFKPLMSHDDRTVMDFTTGKDADGKFTSIPYLYKGWPSFIVNGAYSSTMVEQINRAINMTPEKSKIKDDEMNRSYWEAMSMLNFWRPPEELKVAKQSHEWLPSMFQEDDRDVSLHQFGKHLELLELESRDREKLTGLIQTLAMLHQLNRPKVKKDGGELLLASFEDMMIALGIFEQVYQHSRYGVPKQTYDVLRHLIHMKNDKKREIFTLDEIWSNIKATEAVYEGDVLRFAVKEELKNYLDALLNHGLISHISRKKGQPEKWRVHLEEKDLNSVSLTQLFISKVETGDFMERVNEMENNLNIEYPDYQPFIDEGGKLYNYLMDKHYFRSGMDKYQDEPSAVYKIFSNETRKILFNDKIIKIGHEEIRKKIEMDTEKITKAKQIVSADDWIDTEEGQRWVEQEREKQLWEIQFLEDEGREPEPWEYEEFLNNGDINHMEEFHENKG